MGLPDEIDTHLSDLKASTETVISDLNGNSAKVLDQEPIRVCKEEAPNRKTDLPELYDVSEDRSQLSMSAVKKYLDFEKPDNEVCSSTIYARVVVLTSLNSCFLGNEVVHRPESLKIQVGDQVFICNNYIKTCRPPCDALHFLVCGFVRQPKNPRYSIGILCSISQAKDCIAKQSIPTAAALCDFFLVRFNTFVRYQMGGFLTTTNTC